MIRIHCVKFLLAGICCAALIAMPRLPLPGTGALGLGGPAAAQQAMDVDYFYDQLDPYGQWVWHPRFGYVWLPENVSDDWRPYTVGHWAYTDDYGWYWDSDEPFAWAVYHYGRWGYDPDYGWFWVPGDTWAPAWVQWRYSDNYVGWAPIGPSGEGYAYGAPVSYDPPVAESWVFVQPRYMTAPSIYQYAMPVADLNVAFLGATTVYRPVFHAGVVLNFGMPRDRVARFVGRPIVSEKIVRVTDKTVIHDRGAGGISVYAPGFAKGAGPQHAPKRFAQTPDQFKPKAKLKVTMKGDAPKDLGPSAATVTPIAKQVGAEGFKAKKFGGQQATVGGGGGGGGQNGQAGQAGQGGQAGQASQGGGGQGGLNGGKGEKGKEAVKEDNTPSNGGGGNGKGAGNGNGAQSGNGAGGTKRFGNNQPNASSSGEGEAGQGTQGAGQGGGKKGHKQFGAQEQGTGQSSGGQGAGAGGGQGGGKKGQFGAQGQGAGQASGQGGGKGSGGPGGAGRGQNGGQPNKGGGGQGGGGQGGGQSGGKGKCKQNPEAPGCNG